MYGKLDRLPCRSHATIQWQNEASHSYLCDSKDDTPSTISVCAPPLFLYLKGIYYLLTKL